SVEWDPDFYVALAQAGFISISMRDPEYGVVLVPELQEAYAVLDWPNIHVSQSVQRLRESDRLSREEIELRVVGGGALVLEHLLAHHKPETWLSEPYCDRIANVLRLDQSLGRFLAFIVIAGGAGGLGALASSIYLSVQRSRRQFAVLQILGVPHSTVILSVALQSVVIVMLGSLATLTLFNIGSWMLAAVLNVEATRTGSVCSLNGGQWLILIGSALACAVVSTLMSASRMQFKDPAVIARSE
ncbi:MAG: FtsX-like permease family protein, partial [Roseibacillus sp.]